MLRIVFEIFDGIWHTEVEGVGAGAFQATECSTGTLVLSVHCQQEQD